MTVRPRRLRTALLAGLIVALAPAAVAASAVISAARENQDIAPVLIGGVGRSALVAPPQPDQSPGATNDRIDASLPPGWSVETSTGDELLLAGPHVVVDLLDRDIGASYSAQSLADDAVASYQRRYPDARRCQELQPAAVDIGAEGSRYAICFTDTAPEVRAVPADAVIVEAIDTDSGGARHLLSERVIYRDDDAADAMAEATPVLRSVLWKRHRDVR